MNHVNGLIAVLFSDHINLTVAVPVNTAVIMLATQLEHNFIGGNHFPGCRRRTRLRSNPGRYRQAVQSLVDQVMIACNTVNRQGKVFQNHCSKARDLRSGLMVKYPP